MDASNTTPGLLRIACGYIAAVATAAIVAATVMAIKGPDQSMFLAMVMVGGVYIGCAGLPGFAVTAYLARQHGWSGWLPFTICGGLNALLAWLLVAGLNVADNELLPASIRGGVAGGVAYWWAAYHGIAALRRWRLGEVEVERAS